MGYEETKRDIMASSINSDSGHGFLPDRKVRHCLLSCLWTATHHPVKLNSQLAH